MDLNIRWCVVLLKSKWVTFRKSTRSFSAHSLKPPNEASKAGEG